MCWLVGDQTYLGNEHHGQCPLQIKHSLGPDHTAPRKPESTLQVNITASGG